MRDYGMLNAGWWTRRPEGTHGQSRIHRPGQHGSLEPIGTTLVYIGTAGAGQVAKTCNQICIVVNQLGAAEALLLLTRLQEAGGAKLDSAAVFTILEQASQEPWEHA